MKKSFLLATCYFVALVPVLFSTNNVYAEDLAQVMPNDVKVIVDNDKVRVLEILHKPGAKEPMHSHPAYVAVFLSQTRLKVTTPDGKVVEKDRKAGETLWSEAVTHTVENIGTEDQHVIVVEMKK